MHLCSADSPSNNQVLRPRHVQPQRSLQSERDPLHIAARGASGAEHQAVRAEGAGAAVPAAAWARAGASQLAEPEKDRLHARQGACSTRKVNLP